MEITVQIKTSDMSKLQQIMGTVIKLQGAVEVKAEPVQEDKAETPKTETPKVEAVQEVKAETPKAEPGISLEVVRGKMTEFAGQGKEQTAKAREALTSFGVQSLPDLDPVHYKDLLDKLGLTV